jgi:hypothetical protein
MTVRLRFTSARAGNAHTLRGGLLLRTDLTNVVNTNTLLPVVDDVPCTAAEGRIRDTRA